MTQTNDLFLDGAIATQYFGDSVCPHYLLKGSRLKETDELLKMMVRYGGACTVDPQEFARNGSSCDFNCLNCDRSIYHLVSAKDHLFRNQCRDLCGRQPKIDDEWEISVVEHNSEFKYETIHFLCRKAVESRSIIDLIIDYLKKMYPAMIAATRYCYVKIRRFDMEKAFDVSTEATPIIFAAFR